MARAVIDLRRMRGFAFLELMVVVAVLLAAATVAALLLVHRFPFQRNSLTREKLQALKRAVVGEPALAGERARTSFGFVGDLGVLPSTLDDLRVQRFPAFQAYTAGNATLYYGWRGPYVAEASLVDGWGRAILYTDSTGAAPLPADLDQVRFPVILYSAGEDGVAGNGDDLALTIAETEVHTPVAGNFWTDRHKRTPVDETGVRIHYFDGAALQNVLVTPTVSTRYDSAADTVTPAGRRRIPLGIHCFEATASGTCKVATLNGGPAAVVDFFIGGGTGASGAKLFELTFDASDDTTANVLRPVMTPAGGSWRQSDGSIGANGPGGEYRLVFGRPEWQDYRIELDATLVRGRGYGVYYRSDGLANISGYCFQYDPGYYPGYNATAPPGISFLVRQVFAGAERAPFQRLDRSAAQFPGILGTAHHISITVQTVVNAGATTTRHIVRVDGQPLLDFPNHQFPLGMPGLRSWDGADYTRFHHLLVYGIPPLRSGEIAWWSFEEGGGAVVYGSGFRVDAVENNGLIDGAARAVRGVYGTALSFAGSGRVTVPDDPALRPGRAFSLEAWVRPSDDRVSCGVAFKGLVGRRGCGIYQNISNSPVNGGWNAQVETTAGRFNLCWGHSRPTPNRWYHLALTYDGATARFYVDGTLTASQAVSGAPQWGGDALVFGDGFMGLIDEVVLYDRALTAAEVIGRFDKYRINRW